MNKHLWIWHRRLGALLAVFVIVLCVTGIALNHTDFLRLDQRHVQSSTILSWYGINAPSQAASVQVGNHRISLIGDHLYADQTLIGSPYTQLVGAGASGEMIAVAAGTDILLLSPQLHLIEIMTPTDGIPSDILALGNRGEHLYALNAAGMWQADSEMVGWMKVDNSADVQWSEAQVITGDGIDDIRRDYLGRMLTWERVILDLHSGRLVGLAGPVLADLVALMLIGVAASGLWMWSRRLR
jgi:hypothetical protein